MSGGRGLALVMAQVLFIAAATGPCAATTERRLGNTGRRNDIRAQRAGMIPCLSSQNFIRLRKLLPGAFGSEITKIPHIDEVLTRHGHR